MIRNREPSTNKRRRLASFFSAAAAALLLTTVFAHPCWAHRVTVYAWIEGQTVHASGKFGGGKPAVDSRVDVLGPQGQTLLSGRTDDTGEFTCPLPAATQITLVLKAGSGHQASWTLTAEEIREATGQSPSTKPADPAANSPGAVENGSVSAALPAVDTDVKTVDSTEIRQIVGDVLDEKLKPLTRMMVESRERESGFRDIAGGIGYLVGMAGLAAYFQSRRHRDRHDA